MDQKVLDYFKGLLTQRLENLLKNANDTISELISNHADEIEYLEKATNSTDKAMKLQIKSRESRLINKIMEALKRIENKTYGICDTCGEDISIKRLEARPVTAKCIDCKEEEEKMEHMTR